MNYIIRIVSRQLKRLWKFPKWLCPWKNPSDTVSIMRSAACGIHPYDALDYTRRVRVLSTPEDEGA